jgi:hypothetical protein
MGPGFVSGERTTFANQNDHILDLSNGLDFLNPAQDGVSLLKRLGWADTPASSYKHEWTETALAARSENITIDGASTTLTVANAYQYVVNGLLKSEAEVMRITAIASATTVTVVRGYAGTAAAAHTAKPVISLGSADPENNSSYGAVSDTAARYYNYSQTFSRPVELSNDEIMQASTDGNPLNGQLERRYIEVVREIANAVIHGIRYEDTANKIRTTGGILFFLTTNVQNAAAASLSASIIDAQLLNIVLAGGSPTIIAMHPYQKQKLDALDVNKQMLGKREHTGGNLITQTWQSGVLDGDQTLDIVVDQTMPKDAILILDEDMIEIKPYSGNGKSGTLGVYDATKNGQDGEKKVIRGKYLVKVKQEKAHAYIYNLA